MHLSRRREPSASAPVATGWGVPLVLGLLVAVTPDTSVLVPALLRDGPEFRVLAMGVSLAAVTFRPLRRLGVFLGAWLWVSSALVDAADRALPACVDAFTWSLRATIESVVSRADGQRTVVRLAGAPAGSRQASCELPTGARVRLWWPQGQTPRAGEVWLMRARVRAPRGYSNPGTFDYERWLMGAHLNGTGYVLDAQRLAAAAVSWRTRTRDRSQAIFEARPELEHRGVMLALTTGMASGVTDQTWALLRNTGTVHLMVISGLHLGLVAGSVRCHRRHRRTAGTPAAPP